MSSVVGRSRVRPGVILVPEGINTHIDISGSGTACSEHMEDHAHGIGVKYVYSGKYRLSFAPSTVSGICVKSSPADF